MHCKHFCYSRALQPYYSQTCVQHSREDAGGDEESYEAFKDGCHSSQNFQINSERIRYHHQRKVGFKSLCTYLLLLDHFFTEYRY